MQPVLAFCRPLYANDGDRESKGQLSGGTFVCSSGSVIQDKSSQKVGGNLTIQTPANSRWLAGGQGLNFNGTNIASSPGPTLGNRLASTNAFSLEAWVFVDVGASTSAATVIRGKRLRSNAKQCWGHHARTHAAVIVGFANGTNCATDLPLALAQAKVGFCGRFQPRRLSAQLLYSLPGNRLRASRRTCGQVPPLRAAPMC